MPIASAVRNVSWKYDFLIISKNRLQLSWYGSYETTIWLFFVLKMISIVVSIATTHEHRLYGEKIVTLQSSYLQLDQKVKGSYDKINSFSTASLPCFSEKNSPKQKL